MRDLLSSFWSGIGEFAGAWLLPSFVSVVYLLEVLVPLTSGRGPLIEQLEALQGTTRLLVIGFTALAIALVLASAATPLTRVLEGYYVWPPRLKDRLIQRHMTRHSRLIERVSSGESEDMMRDRERLNMYPRSPRLILPTRLGNALRSGETYSWVQYGFSMPDLWTHLVACAPEPLIRQLRQARTVVDLFVAATWLTVGLFVVTVAAVASGPSGPAVACAAILLALVPFWYQRAVGSVSWYARCMWALSDLARADLAGRLGIRLSGDLDEERKLWRAVSEYVAWGPYWEKSQRWKATMSAALSERGAGAEQKGP